MYIVSSYSPFPLCQWQLQLPYDLSQTLSTTFQVALKQTTQISTIASYLHD